MQGCGGRGNELESVVDFEVHCRAGTAANGVDAAAQGAEAVEDSWGDLVAWRVTAKSYWNRKNESKQMYMASSYGVRVCKVMR